MSESQQYSLHWRGRESGPYTLGQIKRKLASGEITLEHEILADGRWITLHEFFAARGDGAPMEIRQPTKLERPVIVAPDRHKSRDIRQASGDSHARRRMVALGASILLLLGGIWVFWPSSPITGSGSPVKKAASASPSKLASLHPPSNPANESGKGSQFSSDRPKESKDTNSGAGGKPFKQGSQGSDSSLKAQTSTPIYGDLPGGNPTPKDSNTANAEFETNDSRPKSAAANPAAASRSSSQNIPPNPESNKAEPTSSSKSASSEPSSEPPNESGKGNQSSSDRPKESNDKNSGDGGKPSTQNPKSASNATPHPEKAAEKPNPPNDNNDKSPDASAPAVGKSINPDSEASSQLSAQSASVSLDNDGLKRLKTGTDDVESEAFQRGSNLVFLVDQSYSMRGQKGEVAWQQLGNLLAKLDTNTFFYIIFFHSSGYDPMPTTGPLPATPENVRSMLQWSSTARHVFGSNPGKAALRALDLHPQVLWLISDGKFPMDVNTAITASNKTVRAQINTIGIHSRSGEGSLSDLAAKNGGVYRFVPAH